MKNAPIRVGIVGAGAWAAELADCLARMRGVRLTAVANRTLEKARKLALKHNISGVFEDFHDLGRSPEVDAVMVVTHESAHLAPTLAALEAGKDVLVEKPMADSTEAARAMAAKAKETGRILMPGHTLRFDKRCQVAKTRLATAGAVRAIRCFQHRPKRCYETYCRPHVAFPLMIHHLDLCRWFVGCPVVRADCHEGFFLGPDYPSFLWATLEFANGAIATLQSGWVFESDSPCFGEDGVEVITERERITLAFTEDGYEERRSGTVERPHLFPDTALRAEIEEWLRCIEQRTQPTVVTPEDGVEAVALAERLMASRAQKGTRHSSAPSNQTIK